MSREVDRRDAGPERATAGRTAELETAAERVSERLAGGHRVRIGAVDAATGNAARVVSESAPAADGAEIQRALHHVAVIDQALGLAEGQPAEFLADPVVGRTSGGAAAVHLQQRYKGIPIFQAAETVRFAPDGALIDVVGTAVTVAGDPDPLPARGLEEAVTRAARHCAVPDADERGRVDGYGQPFEPAGIELGDFAPRVIARLGTSPERPAVLEPGPFGDKLTARLVWFPLGEELRLAWEVMLTMPDHEAQYRTLVDAQDAEGAILYCRDLTLHVEARGNVFPLDGGGTREMTAFPPPLDVYGLPLPASLPTGFPDPWLAGAETSGNSAHARLGDDGPPGRGLEVDETVTFDPADPGGDDQQVLNIFYFNCLMHDFFYLLGFTEQHDNFQRDNLGRGGEGADPVDARSYPIPVRGTASMSRSIEGRSPRMRMGLVAQTGRHTALDSSVVFHEFTHGVSNRLVGGGMDETSLDAPQSRGANEGISDFIACTINRTVVVGDWVTGNPGGIRKYPYTSDFPDSFGDLGTGRYAGQMPHPIGEIWCATLMEMARNIGSAEACQLLVDGLKLSPTNPSFLDLRDAILLAATHAGDPGAPLSDLERGIWAAFAKFGMGPNAQSNGAQLSGIVADFEPPGATAGRVLTVEAVPDLAIPDFDPVGVRSALQVTEDHRIARLSVRVELAHPFAGDLRVRLIPPSGETIMLHNRGGGDAGGIKHEYRRAEIPALVGLEGGSTAGEWTLWCSDHTGRDTGRLTRWGLTFILEEA